MRVAKAKEEEFERVGGFIRVMEALFDGRSFFSMEECWKEWDDDDEDKKMLLEIERDLLESEGEPVDNRLVLFEFIKKKWRKANYCGSFGRIVVDAQVLIDNACDPDLDYLEFAPKIKAAIEEYDKKNEGHEDN